VVSLSNFSTPNKYADPGRDKRFISSPKRPDWLWDLHSLLFNRYQNSFQGVKQPGHEVNHSTPSIANIKERVELYFYAPICLHCVDRENFTFTFYKYRD
jgi:hypothetical protein